MDRNYQKIQKPIGLLGAICGSLLISLPAFATPGMDQKQLSQANPNPTSQEAPNNPSGASNSSRNRNPGIFNEAPYNRSRTTLQSAPGVVPSQPTAPSSPVIQAPLPEQQQPPSATITPIQGKVSVRLVNQTGANITYQVIGNTNARSLKGKSDVLLTNLPAPVTATFRRDDGGLLSVTTQPSSQPGMLEVILTQTTDLAQDRTTMNIQKTGAVFLN